MELPSTMRAHHFGEGSPPKLQWDEQAAVPIPSDGEALIRVQYSGLNRADLYQTQGKYPLPTETANIPGLEFSGTIVALGDGCTRFAIGDAVCGLVTGGAYADYCTADEPLLLPVPKGLSMAEAASLPEALATAWLALFDRAQLTQGETVLIHGGTSGVGTAAIQLALAFGARVITTAGTAEKVAFCSSLGADAIHYREEDFVERIAALTEGKGVNVLLDMVGGDYIPRNLKCLCHGGRMVSIALMNGSRTNGNLSAILLKNLTWQGVTLRSQPLPIKAALLQTLEKKVWPLLESKQLRPIIDQIFPLSQAKKAQQRMQESLHIGKILLDSGA